MMSDLTDLLDEIQGRANRATKGPWDAYSVPASRGEAGYSAVGVSDTEVQVTRDVGGWLDADFIAHARDDVPRLVTALRAVLGAHTPIEVEPSETLCRECSFRLPSGRYFGKLTEWPCPTVRAITEALEGDPATGDNFPDLLADAWDEGADFAVRHPGMGAEYTRTANQYRLNTEGA